MRAPRATALRPSAGSAKAIQATTNEPTFDASIHTQVFPIGSSTPEDFESYADNAAFRAAYIKDESHGTVALDTSSKITGTKSASFTFNADGCLPVGQDANVGIEKGNLTDYTTTHKDYYMSYNRIWPVGWKFDDASCGGATDMKEVIFFREENNTGIGRVTWHSHKTSTPDLAITNPFNVTETSKPIWRFAIGQTTGSTLPIGASASYLQHLALDTKDPNSLADGLIHRVTFYLRKESAEDVGDGIVQAWIDGTAIMDYVGNDSANAAYHQVYVRSTGFGKTLQMQGILNRDAGLTASQTTWWDDIRVWYRTAS